MASKNHTFVCLDFETGGYDKSGKNATQFAITEVGMVIYDLNFNIISEYQSYVKGQYVDGNYVGYDPDLIYTDGALKATKITFEKLEAKGQDFKVVVAEMVKEFQKALSSATKFKKPILVGQNIGYDIPFLLYLFKYANVSISEYLAGYFDHYDEFHPFAIDTMYMSRIDDPEGKRKHGLEDICTHLGFEHVDAHAALADVKSTMKVHQIFTERMRMSNAVVAEEEQERTRDHFHLDKREEDE